MMNKDEALRLALDALENITSVSICEATHHAKKDRHLLCEECPNEVRHLKAITAIKAALLSRSDGEAKVEPEYYGLTKDHLWMSISKEHYDRLKPEFRMACYTTPPQRTWVGLTPLNIEDEYVRNYLWERALIAIDDPCCRSHPHENMNEYCQRRTELARYQAKLKEKNT